MSELTESTEVLNELVMESVEPPEEEARHPSRYRQVALTTLVTKNRCGMWG